MLEEVTRKRRIEKIEEVGENESKGIIVGHWNEGSSRSSLLGSPKLGTQLGRSPSPPGLKIEES